MVIVPSNFETFINVIVANAIQINKIMILAVATTKALVALITVDGA